MEKVVMLQEEAGWELLITKQFDLSVWIGIGFDYLEYFIP